LIAFLLFGAALLAKGFDYVNYTILPYAVLSLTLIQMTPIAGLPPPIP